MCGASRRRHPLHQGEEEEDDHPSSPESVLTLWLLHRISSLSSVDGEGLKGVLTYQIYDRHKYHYTRSIRFKTCNYFLN